ncbi:MAG: hypothetical protein HQL56_02475 [Magnetococcales bacterium]|nr:hypothetical protein [Magnetococcales bacterium]
MRFKIIACIFSVVIVFNIPFSNSSPVAGGRFEFEYLDLTGDPNASLKKSTCPSREFMKFYNIYTESIDVQKLFTIYPLEVMALAKSSGSDYEIVVNNIAVENLPFPLIDSREAMKAKSIELHTFEYITPRFVQVVLQGNNYNVSYFFTFNSCWELSGIDDWSK